MGILTKTLNKLSSSFSTRALLPSEEAFEYFEHHKQFINKADASKAKYKILRNAEHVFILPSVSLSGGSLSVIQHVNEMQRRKIDARLISLGPVAIEGYELLSPIIRCSYQDIFELDWSRQNVIATFWTTSYLVSKLTQVYPKLKGYYYVQGYEPWFYSEPAQVFRAKEAEQSYNLGLKCVAKSEFLCDMVKTRHGVPVKLITPGIDLKTFYPGNQDQYDGRPRLAALFRPNAIQKGGDELLELVRLLRPRIPDLKVTFFGQKDDLPSDLKNFVNMRGRLLPQQVGELYRNSDVVVDLSHWQGFGRMGIEGMACGAVPIVSDSGGVSRYAKDNHNALIVSIHDLNQVVDRAEELLCNKERRIGMRACAVADAQKFSEEVATDDWLQILK